MLQIRTTSKVGYTKKNKKTDLSQISTVRKPEQNQGGLLGGLGYVGGSIAAGVGGIVEGIVDLGAAGIALLGGDKEYAKYVFKDNVVGDWHQSLTEDYNPGGFNKFVGDVFQGLGQSATMLIPYVGVPAFFLGVGSQGISGAAAKTGDVGFKEVAYGVTSGAIEGGLEYALGAAGKGAKSIGSAIAKGSGKTAVKGMVGGAVRKGLAGKVLSSAAGEFLEESASEIIDVGLQKMYRIDPNAQLSGKDILYSGVVGAFSGGIMGGTVEGIQTLNHRAAGKRIVRDGNAQTLVNTANLVADKLAGQGTSFKKAPEWVKTLRGEVDAYNKLAEKGEQNSAKGETILGEMKASLFFAETQAIHYGVTESIKTSSEENRATLAEYVNQTIEKKNRPRNYTADDIAKDTDGITTQLGILQMAGDTFINYADALASLEADQAQESAIGDVINKTRAESDTAEAEEIKAAPPVTNSEAKATSGIFNARATGSESEAEQDSNVRANTPTPTVNTEAKKDITSSLKDAKYSISTAKKARARIQASETSAQRRLEGIIRTGAETTKSDNAVDNAAPVLDKAAKTPSGVIVGGLAQKSAEGKISGQVSKNAGGVNPSLSGEVAEKSEVETIIRKPKEALTDVQRQERATERAQKLIEREKEATPTVKELNTAREAVKDFDNMPQATKASVVKMIRSADGKVDSQTVKGISNLMTLRRRSGALVMPNVEIRFADIGKNSGGLYTHVGEGENKKTLILVNPTDSFKKTIRGTIAHEVVHYIENRKGYRELADYVMKTAKAEKIAEIEAEYNEHYEAIYTEEAEAEGLAGDAVTKKVAERMATEDHKDLIKSEVVAKLIGLRLNNEKFLKKYATKDDAMIKKIFRFLSASVNHLKDKDKATADEVRELVNKFNDVINGNVTSEEKTGETEFIKYSAMNKESLASNVDKILQMSAEDAIANKEAGNFVSVMKNTPTIIIENVEGAENLEIVMRFDSFYLATRHEGALEGHYHNYGEIMKRLPEIIADPQAIIRMDSGRINIYSQIQTKKGNNSIVSIELNTVKDINSKNNKYNLLVSVMPAKDNYAKNNLLNHGVKVEYEKEDLSQVNHQLHEWLATVNERSSKDSIPQKSDLSTGSEKKTVTRTNSKKMQGTDKRDLAPKKAEKKIEKLEKEKAEAQAKAKQERSMREKLAREAAQVAKAEAAKVYTKKEIEAALKDVEALTNAEILSLAKGLELKGMTKARRDELISKIYILLHSASAQGEAGRGSVAVKMIASKIAWDVIDTAKIFDENGKAMHIVDVYDEASVEGIATYLADTLYQSFANMGEHTSNSYFQAEMRKVKENFNREFINDRKLQRFTREASFQGTQLRQLAETQKRNMEDEGIQKVTKILGSIVDNKGNIRIGKVDEAMAEADRFYSSEGGKLYSEQKEADKATLTEFAWESDGDIQFMIEEFIRLRKGREGKFLTATEMEYLAKVMGGLKTMIKRYNKAYIDGHWVDIEEKAQESAVDLKKFSTEREYKNKLTKWLSEKADKYLQGAYFYNVLSPETVVETLEGFKKNGVLKTLYHTVRVATQKAEHLSVQLKKPFAEFIDDKKNVWEDEKGKKHTYRNKLNKKAISINGAEITLGEAIYLYMLTKREQAHAGLTESGYVTYDDEGKRKLKIKIEDVERTRDMIAAQLDATDKEFLKMADEFFNKTSTDIKYNADMEIFGYSNIQDGYYVPIIRDRYSRMQGVTDQRQSVGSIITVYNKSFNQNTVENAKALEGQNILRIINDHADGLADYSELYLPLKSFDRVYNRKIVLEGGEITSIREILNNEVWTGAQGYFKKLFADIQGQGSEHGFLDGMIGKLRSGWVNSVLGANVKVVATQTTSYVAANQLIEAKYLSAAASKFVGNIDEIRERAYKYSDIIEARNFEMGSLRAQGNIDKVNEIGKKSGFLIGWMDERICLSIFHAAELKAEAQGHGAVGTEENSIAAAKIADEVIYTTQAMTSQAERSALQRSKSEVAKTLSMFTSDSVKQLSHLYRNVMQFVAHKQRAKSDTAYEAELKKDAKMIGRSATTVLTTGIMLGLITQAFKYLYAMEEEEPEEKVKDFAIDMVSSTLNIMPIVSDIADKFVFGYDLSLNVFDIVNDTIEDTSALVKMTGRAMGGQYVSNAEVGKNLINVAKTYSTLFGFPLAPLERTVTGLMRRFTPSTIYGYDAMFKNPSYTADLQRAVEKGDERLAEHILGQLYRNEVTGVYTSEELEIVADLYSKGYTSVIPQKIGESVNDVKLDKKQRQQFNKIYAQASAKVNEMIATAEFKELSEEQQAKAIKNLYSLYYNRAASEVTGKEVSNAQMYSWLTGNYSALFTSQAYKSGLDVVKDSKGKEISVRDQFVEYAQNLGLSEGDYLVIAFANGVRDKKTKAAFIEHINSLKLTDDQKSVIAEKLSLEVKDGKLYEKKE